LIGWHATAGPSVEQPAAGIGMVDIGNGDGLAIDQHCATDFDSLPGHGRHRFDERTHPPGANTANQIAPLEGDGEGRGWRRADENSVAHQHLATRRNSSPQAQWIAWRHVEPEPDEVTGCEDTNQRNDQRADKQTASDWPFHFSTADWRCDCRKASVCLRASVVRS